MKKNISRLLLAVLASTTYLFAMEEKRGIKRSAAQAELAERAESPKNPRVAEEAAQPTATQLLVHAIMNKDLAGVKSALENGANVNKRMHSIDTLSEYDTPLSIAIKLNASQEIIAAILNANANICINLGQKMSPYVIAKICKETDVYLTNAQGNASGRIKQQLREYATSMQSIRVYAQSKKEASSVERKISAENQQALNRSLLNACLEKPITDLTRYYYIIDLLAAGAEVNKLYTVENHINASPLHIAALHGDPTLTEILLIFGANPHMVNHEVLTPLHCVMLFQENPFDKNHVIQSHNPQDQQIIKKYHKTAQLLLDAGSALNERFTSGTRYSNQPLLIAAQFAPKELVQLLVERGADVNAITTYDQSALEKAVLGEDQAVVTYLLEQGADPCTVSAPFYADKTKTIGTPLTRALDLKLENAARAIIKTLLQKSSQSPENMRKAIKSLNQLSHEPYMAEDEMFIFGITPDENIHVCALQLAAWHGFTDIVTLLLQTPGICLPELSWVQTELESIIATHKALLETSSGDAREKQIALITNIEKCQLLLLHALKTETKTALAQQNAPTQKQEDAVKKFPLGVMMVNKTQAHIGNPIHMLHNRQIGRPLLAPAPRFVAAQTPEKSLALAGLPNVRGMQVTKKVTPTKASLSTPTATVTETAIVKK